jgi:predicted short-subunit dehydrogenase-like oxidoreductase (DUF2520 family)
LTDIGIDLTYNNTAFWSAYINYESQYAAQLHIHMLGPLLGAALDNALRFGDAALTGPVARGDAGTVAAHLAELGRVDPHGLVRSAYLAMARLTADRALAAGLLTTEQAATLLDVLGGAV